MKVKINTAVRKVIPELELFYKVIQVQDVPITIGSLNSKSLHRLKLTKQERNSYSEFREKVADSDLLAVERLEGYSAMDDLPIPDPLTGLIIRASYYTNIPVTIFSIDKFNSVEIRFSVKGEYLRTKNDSVLIKPHSLIAATEQGILGILGIKSSYLGKLNLDSRKAAVLSFGCSPATSAKSERLILQIVEEFQTKLGEKK